MRELPAEKPPESDAPDDTETSLLVPEKPPALLVELLTDTALLAAPPSASWKPLLDDELLDSELRDEMLDELSELVLDDEPDSVELLD